VYRWYLCRSTPMRDASGLISKWYGTSTDIHDLRETQDKLRESEAKFRWLFDSNLISTFFWDITGQILEANAAFCTLLDCTPEEIAQGSITLQAATPAELVPRDLEAWSEVQERGFCQPYEKEFIKRNNGRRVPVLVAGALLDGSSTKGIGFAVDLTERKRIEEQLRLATEELEKRVAERTAELAGSINTLQQEVIERIAAEKSLRKSETLLKTVLEHLPVAVWVLDGKADVVTVNPAGKEIWAEERREERGGPGVYKGWWHDTGRPLDEEEWGGWRAVTRGEPTLGEVLDIECFDGSRKTIQYSAVPLTDERGDVIGAVIVNEDVTERIKSEQALQTEVAERLRAMEELRRKDRLLMQQSRLAAMGEMIGNIAHQWRQPLNSLGLIVQGLPLQYEMGDLTKESLEGDTAKAMQIISHMSRTIDDFRNFFRPDKEKVSFSVNEVVAKTVSLVDASFRELQLNIDISPTEELLIDGHPNEYSQVLLNILMNARDAFLERSVPERRVEVRLFREDGKAVVTITDNAGGIAEEILDKIFDPYFTTKGPDKGTGIGLFMAKTIIEKNMN
ncbi:PAS domain S-box protein, partial [bacterium]